MTGEDDYFGFPTANLSDIEEGLPPAGVYTCVVCDATAKKAVQRLGLGVMSLGLRPTVNSGFAAEVHLLDYSGDLYSKRLRVHIIHRLRGIERFADVHALRAQIASDIDGARSKLKEWLHFNPEPLV